MPTAIIAPATISRGAVVAREQAPSISNHQPGAAAPSTGGPHGEQQQAGNAAALRAHETNSHRPAQPVGPLCGSDLTRFATTRVHRARLRHWRSQARRRPGHASAARDQHAVLAPLTPARSFFTSQAASASASRPRKRVLAVRYSGVSSRCRGSSTSAMLRTSSSAEGDAGADRVACHARAVVLEGAEAPKARSSASSNSAEGPHARESPHPPRAGRSPPECSAPRRARRPDYPSPRQTGCEAVAPERIARMRMRRSGVVVGERVHVVAGGGTAAIQLAGDEARPGRERRVMAEALAGLRADAQQQPPRPTPRPRAPCLRAP